MNAPPTVIPPKKSGVPTWGWGLVGVPIFLLGLGLVMPIYSGGHPTSTRTLSLSNLKLIGIAARLYSEDNDDRLHPARNWEETLFPYCKSRDIFTDPLAQPEFANKRGYAMNETAGAVKTTEVESPERCALFFTASIDQVSAVGGRTFLRFDTKYGAQIGFVDGSARSVRPHGTFSPIWDFTNAPQP